MNILLWAPFGAGTHYWGPGTSAFRLYKKNTNKEIKVTLVHSSKAQSLFPNIFFEQIKIGDLENKSIINSLIFLVKSYTWIRKNRHKYDVFHGISAFYFTFLPALFFQKYHKPAFIKIISQNGGFGSNSKLSNLIGLSQLRNKNANRITGYISISKHINKILEDYGILKEKIHYIPNGVDTDRFSPISINEIINLREKLNINNIFTISYIGGLTKNKNVIEIVKAINKLLKKGCGIQFLIVGPDRSNGVVIKEIKDYIENNNLENSIIYVDHTSQPEMYFKIIDVFILNSGHEGLSNSLLEAMSSGVPCIGTPISGTSDLIEDGKNGFFTKGTSDQIAEKIYLLYSDKNLHSILSKEARKTIYNSFSVDQVLSQHLKLFNWSINDFKK